MQRQIEVLHRQADQLSAAGQRQQALAVCQEAVQLAQTSLSSEPTVYITSLTELAHLREAEGDLMGARPLYEQALSICEQVLGPDHPETVTSLTRLGWLLHNLGDLTEARPYLEKALVSSCRVLGNDHPETQRKLSALGSLLWEMGNLTAARRYLEQALEVSRRVLGNDHPDTALNCQMLGYLLQDTGDLSTARRYLEEGGEITLRLMGLFNSDYAERQNKLGMRWQAVGDLAEAGSCLELALRIYRGVLGNDHPDTARSLNNLGLLLREMGDLIPARAYLEEALAVYRRVLGNDHLDTAVCLNNLGLLCHRQGDLAAARPHYEQALEVRRRVLSKDHADTAQSLNNLGLLCHHLGDLAAARIYYEQALEILQKVPGNDHPDTATCLNNLGILEVVVGRIDEALALMRQASAIGDRMIGRIFTIGSDRQRLLFLQKLQGNQESFLSLFYRHLAGSPEAVREAFDLVVRRKALSVETLSTQRAALFARRYPHLRTEVNQSSLPYARAEFFRTTYWRERTAQKVLAGPDLGETLEHHKLALLHLREIQEFEETGVAQITHEILDQERQKADGRAVALALPEGVTLVEFVRFQVFDFHAVSPCGKERWNSARYLAFVLPSGEPDQVQMIDLGEAGPIDQLIGDFLAGLTGSAELRDLTKVTRQGAAVAEATFGVRLRAAIFDPLAEALGVCRRLLLAPDGELNRLPFEVLPLADGRHLLDDYRLSYVSVGRDVLRFGSALSGQPTEPLVVADPNFDLGAVAEAGVTGSLTSAASDSQGGYRFTHRRANPAHELPLQPVAEPLLTTAVTASSRLARNLNRSHYNFPRLPGTRVEGENVGRRLGVQPWLADAALEGQLKACGSPRILHLATHGFFLPDQQRDSNQFGQNLEWRGVGDASSLNRLSGPGMENPMLRSGLALAGANSFLKGAPLPFEVEDGLLTAEDVVGFTLLDTELVVLSACETGLGTVRAGEGVFGLRRAFIVAGARTLVMSLWKVPDLATAFLMDRFYDNLLTRGLDRDLALSQAQRATRDATVGQLKQEWLTPAMIERLAAGDAEARRRLDDLSAKPDGYQPFEHPVYWGAFICQGDTAPLRASAGDRATSQPEP
jgi:CHAT domain-containing protein/tetratricopeptide (TPR) repeat protein